MKKQENAFVCEMVWVEREVINWPSNNIIAHGNRKCLMVNY